MRADLLRLLSDSRLSADARVCGLFIATRPDEWTEIERDEFRRLLGGAGKERVVNALAELELWKYVERKNGGRGHADAFKFSVTKTPPLSDSVPETRPLSADSVTETRTLNDAPSTTTDTSTTPTTKTRANGPPADTDVARLRLLLGDHARALDMMLESADHAATWVAAVLGKFGPTGTMPHVFRGIPPDRHPAVLANAMFEWASSGKVFKSNHFDGFVRKAADNERNGNGNSGSGGATPGEAKRPTGTDGPGRRSAWVIET